MSSQPFTTSMVEIVREGVRTMKDRYEKSTKARQVNKNTIEIVSKLTKNGRTIGTERQRITAKS